MLSEAKFGPKNHTHTHSCTHQLSYKTSHKTFKCTHTQFTHKAKWKHSTWLCNFKEYQHTIEVLLNRARGDGIPKRIIALPTCINYQ